MAETTRKRLYEILIRMHPDGTYGAQQQFIRDTMDGDTVVPGGSSIAPPQPLAMSDVGGAIDEAFVNVTNERNALLATVATYAETITEQAAEIERLNAIIAGQGD